MSAWSCQVRVDIQLISWNASGYSQLHRLTGGNLLTFFLTYLLTFCLTFFLTFFKAYLLTLFLTFFLAYLLTLCLAYLLTFCLNLSDISCDILSDRSCDILSDIPPDILSDVLSDISSDVLSDISSDISSAFFLIFFLACLLTFFLTYLLKFCLTFVLTPCLTFFLTFLLTFFRTFFRTFFLTFFRTFFLAGNTDRRGSRLRSGREHWTWRIAVEGWQCDDEEEEGRKEGRKEGGDSWHKIWQPSLDGWGKTVCHNMSTDFLFYSKQPPPRIFCALPSIVPTWCVMVCQNRETCGSLLSIASMQCLLPSVTDRPKNIKKHQTRQKLVVLPSQMISFSTRSNLLLVSSALFLQSCLQGA